MPTRWPKPDWKTLPISRGETLTVKKRLTSGEHREAYNRNYTMDADGRRQVNPLYVGVSMVMAYLIDWTVKDDDGAIVPIRLKRDLTDTKGVSVDEQRATLDALSLEDFNEIKTAIEAHETAMGAERDAEKNAQDGATKSPATSPSPSDAAGASSGSES